MHSSFALQDSSDLSPSHGTSTSAPHATTPYTKSMAVSSCLHRFRMCAVRPATTPLHGHLHVARPSVKQHIALSRVETLRVPRTGRCRTVQVARRSDANAEDAPEPESGSITGGGDPLSPPGTSSSSSTSTSVSSAEASTSQPQAPSTAAAADGVDNTTQPSTSAAAAGAPAPYPYMSQTPGEGPSAPTGGGGQAGGAVSLGRKVPGVGATFLLAGMLKILTLGGLAASAPVDVSRTAAGKISSYLLVPVGLGLAWLAKQIVDTGLVESRNFLRWMVVVLVVVYFGLVKVLYRADPSAVVVNRPAPRLPGPMGELRSQLGDRELLVDSSVDPSGRYGGRVYRPERPDRDERYYDDVAWYEGRYPQAPGSRGSRGDAGDDMEGEARQARPTTSRPRRSFLSAAEVPGAGSRP